MKIIKVKNIFDWLYLYFVYPLETGVIGLGCVSIPIIVLPTVVGVVGILSLFSGDSQNVGYLLGLIPYALLVITSALSWHKPGRGRR